MSTLDGGVAKAAEIADLPPVIVSLLELEVSTG
jgi:hypothetical protein